MPSRRSNKKVQTPAVDALTGDEHSRVPDELLRAHPDLRSEAEQAARRLLEAGTAEGTAVDVAVLLAERTELPGGR